MSLRRRRSQGPGICAVAVQFGERDLFLLQITSLYELVSSSMPLMRGGVIDEPKGKIDENVF